MLESHTPKKSTSPKQTAQLGFKLARHLLKKGSGKGALVVALTGELGSGKTTFLQGFAKGLGIREKITSPTFVIMKRFKIKDSRFKNLYHIDCYRVQKPQELSVLGLKKIISEPQNIIVVEWADQVRRAMPKYAIWIEFLWHGETEREIRYGAIDTKTERDKVWVDRKLAP